MRSVIIKNTVHKRFALCRFVLFYIALKDEDGRIEWRCDCLLEENGRSFTNFASSKKEAQKMSAYDALLDLIGMFEDD